MTIKKVAFACGMAMVAAGAVSSESKAAEGFYASVHGGAVLVRETTLDDITATTTTGTTTTSITLSDLEQEFDRGFAIGGEGGYAFGNGLRVGAEITYRRNKLGDLSGNATASTVTATGTTTTTTSFDTDVDEDVSSWAFMLNGYFDINTGTPITPYVGAGAGAAIVNLDLDLGTLGAIDDSDTVFAYQGIVGVAYALTDNVDIGLEYRYFATSNPTFKEGGGEIEADYGTHNVFLKATYHM